MAFAVNTNSYISVADADVYWYDRNNSTWDDKEESEKEAALIEATQYIDNAYSFIGSQITTQTLAWPRNDAFIQHGNFAGKSIDNTTIPQQIKDAVCELALEALTARLEAVASRGGAIKREKVDTIEVEYADWAPSGKTYGFVGKLLSSLLEGGGNSHQARLVRT